MISIVVFSSKCTAHRLATGLCFNPLEELISPFRRWTI